MNRYLKTGTVALLALLAGCTEADKFNPDREIVLFSGTDSTPLIKVDSGEYGLTVSATGKATEDVTVYVEYDKSALESYNAAHKTTYQAVPESAIELESKSMVIRQGQVLSSINNVSIKNYDYVQDGYIYVIPLSISRVEGGSYEILETSKSILVRPTQEYRFHALDVNNPNLSSNYIFKDEQAIELSTYTYEIKFYAYSLKDTGTDMICRLCAWEAKDESKANMLRFGENGYPGHSLQLVSPAGNIVSATEFDPGKWYMLSLVYDGSAMVMYVNGVAEPSKGANDGTTTFQRFEMGMSWGGYCSSQLFSGRIAEVRVWDRALSVNEMKEGICGVAPDAEGLRAYWKFNEGSGHIFHDVTGNGYDMDWSDTWRSTGGNDTLDHLDKGSIAEGQWVKDDLNICRN